MKGAYHTSWYAQFNVQDLRDCLSSHFGGDEFLQLPFFPAFEHFQPLEINISHAVSITSLDLELQTRSAELWLVSDPSSWPSIYKVLVSILLNAFPLFVSVGISILSSAGEELVKEFKTRPELALLTTSLFMLGFVFGPFVWDPLSEMNGRRNPLIIGLTFFALFCVSIALAKSLSTILICRFLSGAFGFSSMAVTGGALTDLWSSPMSRGIAMDCFVITGFIGSVLGSMAGTFIVHSSLRWRWTMWITATVSASLSLFAFVFLPEKYKPSLLPNQSPRERLERPIGHRLELIKEGSIPPPRDHFSRPPGLFATEPILVLVTLYMSFCYGLLFLFMESYPIAFREVRGWSLQLTSLTFFGVIIGVGCDMLGVIAHALTVLAKKIAVAQGNLVPGQRLPPMILGGILLPLGLFCFAWTSKPHTIWTPQVLAGIPVGAAMFAILIQGIKYIVDVYFRYANSAISTNTIVRSFFAASFPLFSSKMYHMLRDARTSPLLRHRHRSGRDDIYNYHDLN